MGMTRFFWDTNLFIYRWDNKSILFPSVKMLHNRMLASQIGLVTSTLALGELQVGPRKSGDTALALRYKATVSQMATVVPFDEPAADAYTLVRQNTKAKGPDAIHLACAAAHQVELFVTNDNKLQGLRIPGIQFIVSIQTALQLMP
jgi:predicted nucleic acid-binding protein